MAAVVLHQEFSRADAPLTTDFFGETLVGPTLLRWGTDEQKRRFLPGILNGKVTWCQGFSEPDAGSDLASLTTRAELVDGNWVINGQKVWTTRAQCADYIFILARTDASGPKQAGISFLLVPMDQPGIEVSPIRQMDGSAGFSETRFHDALCPEGNLVGGVNNGWRVAMTTLGFERATSAITSFDRFERELHAIIDRARAAGRTKDPLVRQRLALAWSRVQIMKASGWRSVSAISQGKKDPGVVLLDSTSKLFWSEHHQDVTEMAVDILGMDGLLTDRAGTGVWDAEVGAAGAHSGSNVAADFLASRADTIWGGTSEIQRDIVGALLRRGARHLPDAQAGPRERGRVDNAPVPRARGESGRSSAAAYGYSD